MPPVFATELRATPRDHRLLALLLVLPLLVSLAAVWALDHAKAQKSLFTTSNMVGPTAKSLLDGGGLTACTEDMGTPGNPICFHSARMPLNALVVALGIRLLGDRYLPVALFKTVLLLLPLEFAIYLVWRRLLRQGLPHSRWRTAAVVLLLLAPFAILAFLADVANILVEEGYSYSFLTAAVALLFFGRSSAASQTSRAGWGQAVLFTIALCGLYLSKSSLLPAVVVLAAGFFLLNFLLNRAAGPRLLVALFVVAAPLGWAVHQHHASGRYSISTSFDGINLHKGNNAEFLAHYPPPPGDSLDRFDPDLNRGLHFSDEWSFNDYHHQAAMDFLRTHPRATLQGDARKLYVLFFSVEKSGSSASHGIVRAIEEIGMALFRLMLWAAIGCAVYLLVQGRENYLRVAGGIFLALVAACALPYLAGFAYTRHISVLIYPAALMCCRALVRDDPTLPAP
jgi:hypothetical protein